MYAAMHCRSIPERGEKISAVLKQASRKSDTHTKLSVNNAIFSSAS